jgi:hypothetical protein
VEFLPAVDHLVRQFGQVWGLDRKAESGFRVLMLGSGGSASGPEPASYTGKAFQKISSLTHVLFLQVRCGTSLNCAVLANTPAAVRLQSVSDSGLVRNQIRRMIVPVGICTGAEPLVSTANARTGKSSGAKYTKAIGTGVSRNAPGALKLALSLTSMGWCVQLLGWGGSGAREAGA